MKWKPSSNKYENGELLFLGKWRVMSLIWNSSGSKDPEKNYKATSFLPGLKKDLGECTFKDGKILAEKAVKLWLERAGVK